jgi:hypothetical protein
MHRRTAGEGQERFGVSAFGRGMAVEAILIYRILNGLGDDLDEISLDFRPEATDVTVMVEGLDVTSPSAEWTQPYFGSRHEELNYSKLIVPVTSTITTGTEFTVTVDYTTVIHNTLNLEPTENADNPEGFSLTADGRGAIVFGEPL